MVTYKLTAIVNHKTMKEPVIHEFIYTGKDKHDALDKIDSPAQHIRNLKQHGKTSFSSKDGVYHQWKIELVGDDAEQ
jgi:hypothetical protein